MGEVHNCSFDTARVAGILLYTGDARKLRGVERREELARDIMKTYTQYLNEGYVGYSVTDLETEERLDSCWGFIESKDAFEHIWESGTIKEDTELVFEDLSYRSLELADFLAAKPKVKETA